ncbi:MAG: hypothetical protein ACK6D7_27370, partial [Acidobacteriota bacterium]
MLPDSELLPMLKQRVFSALLGDVLDKMGYLHQFLPPGVRPLRDDMILAGRATAPPAPGSTPRHAAAGPGHHAVDPLRAAAGAPGATLNATGASAQDQG